MAAPLMAPLMALLMALPVGALEARADQDPLVGCRALMLDERFDDAERCLRALLDAPEPATAARARALLDVVLAWRPRVAATLERSAAASAADAATPPDATVASAADAAAPPDATIAPRQQLHVQQLLEDGAAEAAVHGALAGAGAGFLVSATVASATRASEADTIGWLIAAPAVGGAAGAAGSWAVSRLTQPNLGDLRLATSTMWMGALQGFTLQLAVFDQSADVGAVPLRFATVLGGGVFGLGAGAALGPLVDIEDGDVAVAHSAAFWGGVLSTTVLLGVTNAGVTMSGPVMVAIIAGGIGVPYLAALVAHELLTIERWPSYLIDGGAAAGMLISGAVMAAFSVSAGSSAVGASVLMTTGLLAGLAVGTIAATMTSDAVRAEARVFENNRRLDEGAE